MPLLAIESSTEHCGVALEVNGEVLERHTVEPRAHASLILPWCQALLAEAELSFSQLDGLTVSRGPGGFTSLRIGLGIVQGLALAHDHPVYPVSSLDALALNIDPAGQQAHLIALLDARMDEVYWAAYQGRNHRPVRLGDEHLSQPDSLALPAQAQWQLAGPGALAYADRLRQALGSSVLILEQAFWPTAPALLTLAREVEPVAGHTLSPSYLRDQVTG